MYVRRMVVGSATALLTTVVPTLHASASPKYRVEPFSGTLKIIFYSSSGGSSDSASRQVAYLRRFGSVTIDDDSLILPPSKAAAAPLVLSEAYDASQLRLRDADIVVADVTVASTGVGLLLGSAVAQGKKILVVHKAPSAFPALLQGCGGLSARSYGTDADFQAAVRFTLSPQRVFLFGPPGSGKGTLAAYLSTHLGLVHLSTGDVLRAYRKEKAGTDDALARELASYMDAGKLVPAATMAGVVAKALSDERVKKRGYILDGYPGCLEDGQALAEMGVFPTSVLVLKCDPSTAVARQVSRHERKSDVPDLAAVRVKNYADLTAPVLATYAVSVELDASQPIEGVRKAAVAALLDSAAQGSTTR